MTEWGPSSNYFVRLILASNPRQWFVHHIFDLLIVAAPQMRPLMIGGITVIGVVTASLASWIVQRVPETDRACQTATAAHIDELRDEIRMPALQVRRSR
jgi:voltage-gated potassium channel